MNCLDCGKLVGKGGLVQLDIENDGLLLAWGGVCKECRDELGLVSDTVTCCLCGETDNHGGGWELTKSAGGNLFTCPKCLHSMAECDMCDNSGEGTDLAMWYFGAGPDGFMDDFAYVILCPNCKNLV